MELEDRNKAKHAAYTRKYAAKYASRVS